MGKFPMNSREIEQGGMRIDGYVIATGWANPLKSLKKCSILAEHIADAEAGTKGKVNKLDGR
jgi:hypothetical protein